MNVNAKKTEFVVKRYLEKERKILYGMYMGHITGGFCQATMDGRSYHIDYIIDEDLKRFFVEISG